MNQNAHVGDAAELYAAGALAPEERASVDAHIAHCSECLRRVGEAEETVLALERVNAESPAGMRGTKVLPFQRRGVPLWWVPVAAAAALIFGLFLAHRPPQNDAATLAMLHSHFAHAQFAGNGPAAKVLYARDRSWYYIIVAGNHRYEVDGIRSGQALNLGSTQPKSQTSELFSSTPARFDRIELRDAGKTLEAAAIR